MHRKSNIKVRGLKENIEGVDLVGFLVRLFSGWVGSSSESKIRISTAFQVGVSKALQRYPRDVIVKFPEWNIKSVILET